MKLPLTGGCACGAIRYECGRRPLLMFFCHCRDCQRAGGGPYSAAVLLPGKAFKLTQGTPKYFSTPSLAGGHHTRGFCPECGSRLLGAVNPKSPFIGVLAASLDDPGVFQPAFNIFTSDAQPWAALSASLPGHEFYPPK